MTRATTPKLVVVANIHHPRSSSARKSTGKENVPGGSGNLAPRRPTSKSVPAFRSPTPTPPMKNPRMGMGSDLASRTGSTIHMRSRSGKARAEPDQGADDKTPSDDSDAGRACSKGWELTAALVVTLPAVLQPQRRALNSRPTR
ncbi:hypothetical protein NMY22_g2719 [Coprinellus aureogranulatus]|nr:hypothetical protein NMY22_g2719 [Coprinellus aureogranulatus]